MIEDSAAWRHAIAVTRPALLLASPDYLHEIATQLRAEGIQDAVARHDTAALFDWLITMVSLQGISDSAALAFDAAHGGIRHSEIAVALASEPSCPRLRCYWTFEGCGYRKGTGACAEPAHRPRCPLPGHPLRKGNLNVAAYSLFLFVRDVCDGDFVGWMDGRLAGADPGLGGPDRGSRMRAALLAPLCEIAGIGPKLWSMMLADLLLAGDPARERWIVTGAGLIAVDTLVHNFLHRTGILRRFGAEHPYGPACYGPNGCTTVIQGLAARIDARALRPAFPAIFPRFVQHVLWRFCAADELDICNGNRIDDCLGCKQVYCPARPSCDRLRIKVR